MNNVKLVVTPIISLMIASIKVALIRTRRIAQEGGLNKTHISVAGDSLAVDLFVKIICLGGVPSRWSMLRNPYFQVVNLGKNHGCDEKYE